MGRVQIAAWRDLGVGIEQESVSHPWTGFVVARYSNDIEGNYIIAVAAVG